MPIKIYRVTAQHQGNEDIAWLCDDEWLLRAQVETLSKWLESKGAALRPGEYVADIGFCWRGSARAGGPVLEPAAMKRMADLGMSLFLSEYPGFGDEAESEESKPSAAPNGGTAAQSGNSGVVDGPPVVS